MSDIENIINDNIKLCLDNFRQIIYNIKGEGTKKINKDKFENSIPIILNNAIIEMKKKYLFPGEDHIFSKYDVMDTLKFFNEDEYTFLSVKYPEFLNYLSLCYMTLIFQSMGDTLGYYNGLWEFNNDNPNACPEYVNELIYQYFNLGGFMDINFKNMIASDDTILYQSTLISLYSSYLHFNKLSMKNNDINIENSEFIKFYGKTLRNKYLDEFENLKSRHPGVTTMNSLESQKNIRWDKLPYNSKSIGAGSAMRTGCLGIVVNDDIIISILAIEASRITHNSATAILGAITSALFTKFSIMKYDINEWPNMMLDIINSNDIDEYMASSRKNEYKSFERDRTIFIGKWKKYISLIHPGINPNINQNYMKNPVLRYENLTERFSQDCDIPGSCGDDATIMAYDSLIRCNGSIEKLIMYSILHPGDSDTVGSMAFSWYCGYFHKPDKQVLFTKKFLELEFIDKIINTARCFKNIIIEEYFSVILFDHMLHEFLKYNFD